MQTVVAMGDDFANTVASLETVVKNVIGNIFDLAFQHDSKVEKRAGSSSRPQACKCDREAVDDNALTRKPTSVTSQTSTTSKDPTSGSGSADI